jgi:hypothetical protein
MRIQRKFLWGVGLVGILLGRKSQKPLKIEIIDFDPIPIDYIFDFFECRAV